MQIFDTEIHKDESGRLTIIELPFNAKEVFSKPKGTIYVKGTINNTQYRSKLLSRGGGKYIMVLDKALQKALGFEGTFMKAHITMSPDDSDTYQTAIREPVTAASGMDVLTAIKTRQSIRKFTSEPISGEILNTILYAGLCAPTAKNKRPYHFIVIKDKQLLSELAQNNTNAAMLESAPCAIVVCGDKNIEALKEFMYEDCAAASQNILLSIHGLGFGGVWCGVAAHSEWRKLLADRLSLPVKLEPVSVIALGRPDETKQQSPRWETQKIHYDTW